MGIELLTLAVTAATTIASTVQARKAAKSRKRAQAISNASEEIQNRTARRRAAREERIRRARLVQSAETSGAENSSGLVGATSALGSNLAAGIANQSSQRRGAQAISAANQKATDAEDRGRFFNSLGSLAKSGLDFFEEAKNV